MDGFGGTDTQIFGASFGGRGFNIDTGIRMGERVRLPGVGLPMTRGPITGSAPIDINNFANIDASAFGFRNFAPQYVDIENFDFNNARQSAAALAPRDAITSGELQQVVVGRRFRSGFARQTETSSASREGRGSGEAGIELTAARSASQDATQQFSQTANGEGKTEQGAAYAFERNQGQIRFQPVQLESLPVHSGPRSQLPSSSSASGGGLRGLAALGAGGFSRQAPLRARQRVTAN